MPSAPNSRGEHAERYRIDGELGAGGMGEVLRGVHVELGRPVAIKRLKAELTLDDSMLRRFENEARAVNLIRHENIVEVTDFYRDRRGRMHMVMELLEGKPLSALIRESAPLSTARAAHIGAQIADALGAAHACGVIHRDLKPDNVFLIRRKSTDDYVKLLDFGIARLRPECGGLEATKSGAIIGTPVYMSPEQAQGIAVDTATDMYSLGVILYELVTGHWPFPRSSAVQMMMAHITEAPGAFEIPSFPEEFAALIRQCLAKEPKERPQRMHDVSSLLDTWAQATALGAESTSPVSSGLSDTFLVTGTAADPLSDSHVAPIEKCSQTGGGEPLALAVEEQTASRASPRRVLPVLALALLLGGGGGWLLLRGASTASGTPEASTAARSSARPVALASASGTSSKASVVRAKLDAAVQRQGWPPIPERCKTSELAITEVLLRASEFFVTVESDGKVSSAREATPSDKAALHALESLGSTVNPEVNLWRARAYLRSSDERGAMAAATLAEASCGDMAAAYGTEATALAAAGDDAAALSRFEKALSLAPDYVDARFNLALSQWTLEQYAAALGSVSRVIDLEPTASAYFFRGQCALQLGDAASAVRDLQQVVSEREGDANAWYVLGMAFAELEQFSESKSAYCRARSLGESRAPCADSTASARDAASH